MGAIPILKERKATRLPAPTANPSPEHFIDNIGDIDLSWREDGNCWASGKEMLSFPPGPNSSPQDAALICEGCPVVADCLQYALETDAVGIYGGLYFPWKWETRQESKGKAKSLLLAMRVGAA